MLNMQREFEDFHEKIKLLDENEKLREKRDILLGKLKNNISDEAAKYTNFVQGSYAMGTGINPEDEDYDIDVGLKFDIDKNDYPDPIVVKKWVRDALNGHTKSVAIRRSCVTVTYQRQDEPIYHVDFAVYAASNRDGKLYIAKGKEFSGTENKVWELTDPEGLINAIKSKYSGNDAKQFRRVIRYLKKWKSHNFSTTGNEAPTGISLTTLAFYHFSTSKNYDAISGSTTYNDLAAFSSLVSTIKNLFKFTWNSEDSVYYHTISVLLPVVPGNDLFEKMSEKQMENFYQKIVAACEKLDQAKVATKRSEACKILIELFGEDFPMTVDKSTVGTSESA